jgi:hypothetical protein
MLWSVRNEGCINPAKRVATSMMLLKKALSRKLLTTTRNRAIGAMR